MTSVGRGYAPVTFLRLDRAFAQICGWRYGSSGPHPVPLHFVRPLRARGDLLLGRGKHGQWGKRREGGGHEALDGLRVLHVTIRRREHDRVAVRIGARTRGGSRSDCGARRAQWVPQGRALVPPQHRNRGPRTRAGHHCQLRVTGLPWNRGDDRTTTNVAAESNRPSPTHWCEGSDGRAVHLDQELSRTRCRLGYLRLFASPRHVPRGLRCFERLALATCNYCPAGVESGLL